MDRQAGLLAKAHQEPVDLAPQLPVGTEAGSVPRRDIGGPSHPSPDKAVLASATPGQPALQGGASLLWGLGHLLRPPQAVGDSVHVCVHCCLGLGWGDREVPAHRQAEPPMASATALGLPPELPVLHGGGMELFLWAGVSSLGSAFNGNS